MKSQYISIEALTDASIPKKFWELNPDTYQGEKLALLKANHFVKKFKLAREFGHGLFLIGEKGTCKTFLATYVLRSLMVRGYDCSYFTFRSLVELHNQVRLAGGSFLRKFAEPDCVVVDDVNTPNLNQINFVLEPFVRFRTDHARPFVLVSQITDEDILHQMFSKFWHRIMTHLIFISCSNLKTRKDKMDKFFEELKYVERTHGNS